MPAPGNKAQAFAQRRSAHFAIVVLGLVSFFVSTPAGPVHAQQGLRPGDRELETPEPAEPRPLPRIDLVPDDATTVRPSDRLSEGAAGLVRRIEVTGSTVFAPDTLAAAVAPYAGRLVSMAELFAARDAVTALYQDAGYATSGAIVPDQDVVDGVVRIEIVEGQLEEIEIRGTRRFQGGYFRRRLAGAGRAPVNVRRIEAQLQRFQADRLVARVSASLVPGTRRGMSRLRLDVEEALGVRLDLAASNHRPPSLGEYDGEVALVLPNIFGVADALTATYRVAEGLQDIDARYSIPLNRFDTRLLVGVRASRGEVVLPEFNRTDIVSRSLSWLIGLEQPLYLRDDLDVLVGLTGESRTSRTEIRNRFFCTITGESGNVDISAVPAFQAFGALDCDPEIVAARFYQQLTWTSAETAVALRSTVTAGLDAFGATRNPHPVADGKFFAWLIQSQAVRRLPPAIWPGAQVVARVDAQLATDPLLSLEKFSVGGARTVRGYRENQLVRDNGVAASVELRLPLLRRPVNAFDLSIVPFADVGRGWDEAGPSQQPSDFLASVGAGLRLGLLEAVTAELFYGAHLTRQTGPNGDGLQRRGLHFRVVVDPLSSWR